MIIVFDVDGVLVDSLEAHAESYNLAFKKNRLRVFPLDKIWKLFSAPREKIIKKLIPNISDRKLKVVAEDKGKFFIEETFKMVKPIPRVDESLFELKKKYKLAIASNAQHSAIIQTLGRGRVNARMFDVILGANDIKNPKPDPEAIKKIEKTLGDKVEYVVGDHAVDIELAGNAGARGIGVLTGISNINELQKADPYIILRNVSLLPEILD